MKVKEEQHTSISYEFTEREFQESLGIPLDVFPFSVSVLGSKIVVRVAKKNKKAR